MALAPFYKAAQSNHANPNEHSLGGRGGRPNAVTISNSDVIVLSNNDVILRSEGGGGQKRPKNCGHP